MFTILDIRSNNRLEVTAMCLNEINFYTTH